MSTPLIAIMTCESLDLQLLPLILHPSPLTLFCGGKLFSLVRTRKTLLTQPIMFPMRACLTPRLDQDPIPTQHARIVFLLLPVEHLAPATSHRPRPAKPSSSLPSPRQCLAQLDSQARALRAHTHQPSHCPASLAPAWPSLPAQIFLSNPSPL